MTPVGSSDAPDSLPTQPGPWRVRLGKDAEGELRGLAPVTRKAVATALDLLAQAGPQGITHPNADGSGAVTFRSGPVSLLVVFDHGSRVALVVRVSLESRRRPHASSPSLSSRLGDLVSDVRVSIRSLARVPAFSVAVVLTLTVGLGGSTAVLGLVNTVYRSALPFDRGDDLVRLRTYSEAAAGTRLYNVSPRDFHAIREDHRSFEGVVAMGGGSVAILGDGAASRVSAVSVSEGWGQLLGVQPIRGRLFTADEEAQGPASGVALVSHGVWERFLSSRPDVVGSTLATAEGALEVVGVLPERFSYPYDAGVWLPGRFDRSDWRSHPLNVVARLRGGVSIEQASADMGRLYGALEESFPGTTPDNGVHVTSARDDFIRDHADSLRGLAAAVVFLLLLACANVGNLLTIRLLDRERETVLRAVLGASRASLVRLAMIESLVLFLIGGMGSLALAAALGRSAGALIPDVLRTQLDLSRIRFDPAVVMGALGVALLAGLLTGAVAAVRAARRDLQGALREGGRGATGGASGRLQNVLVISEVSLALVLLVGAGVLFSHFRDLRTADLGFQLEDRVTLQVVADTERYADPATRAVLFTELEARIRAIPQVADVGIASVNPLCCGDWGAPLRIEGLERPTDAPPLLVHHGYVSSSYFDAVGMPVLRGRNFVPSDRPDAPPVVIVDEALAARFWPGEDPIGKRLGLDRPGQPLRTVVGVVPHIDRQGDYAESWYLPLHQEPTGPSTEIVHLVIQRRSDGALAAARQVVAEIDPSLATFGGTTLTALREENIGSDRIGAVLAIIFAAVGLLLACLGLYGVLAYRVALQTREIGTRIALGAQAGSVVGHVLMRSVPLLAVGLVAGTGAALGVNRLLTQMVVGVGMASPALLGWLLAVVAFTGVGAALVPAVRAARLDPAKTVQG